MGEFAKTKIISAINYLVRLKNAQLEKESYEDETWDRTKVLELINIIGEPLIQKSMLDLYRELFPKTKQELQLEIDRLTLLRDSQN